jgi:hypothetical protein
VEELKEGQEKQVQRQIVVGLTLVNQMPEETLEDLMEEGLVTFRFLHD